MAAAHAEQELGAAPVDPVTGAVLETAEMRQAGLKELRRLMQGSLDSGKVERYPR